MNKYTLKILTCVLFALSAVLLLINDLSVSLLWVDITCETIILAIALLAFASSVWYEKNKLTITALVVAAVSEIIAGIRVSDCWDYVPFGTYLLGVGICIVILLVGLIKKSYISLCTYIAASIRVIAFIVLSAQWGFSIGFFVGTSVMSAAIIISGIYLTSTDNCQINGNKILRNAPTDAITNAIDAISQLSDLKDKGILTQEEFEKKKIEILNR